MKIEKKRRKIVKGKVEMEVGKVLKRGEDPFFFFFFFFFFFCFSLLKTTEIGFFRSTKMGIFYREKTFHTGKKIRKNDFAPSEKYPCYAPEDRGHNIKCPPHDFLYLCVVLVGL